MTEHTTDDAAEELGYEAAIVELERIVSDLQNDEVGVDELATRGARGATLVEVCRDKLRRAELAVEEVVDALQAAEEDGPAPVADEEPAAERGDELPF